MAEDVEIVPTAEEEAPKEEALSEGDVAEEKAEEQETIVEEKAALTEERVREIVKEEIQKW